MILILYLVGHWRDVVIRTLAPTINRLIGINGFIALVVPLLRGGFLLVLQGLELQ